MKKNQRSVLFICADQWRYDYFGFMKHKAALTPNIDKLAEKSSVFKSHFAGIVPCGPSRTTMLTGLYPFIHRSVTNGTPLDKRFTNIAKEVRKIGYVPSLYGYTDTSWDPRNLNPKDKKNFTYESPMEGFESKYNLPGSEPESWAKFLKKNGFKINKSSDLYKGKYPKNGEGFIYEPYKIPSEFSDTAFLANQVMKDLRKKNNSFFKHISFLKPHPPYNIADPWFSLFKSKNIDLPNVSLTFKQLGKKHPLLNEIVKKFLDKESYKEIRYSELKHKDVKNIRKSYLAMCAEVDYYIGKILKTLEESNQLNNTMIIFTSDHGEMLGENNLWGKLGWWDASFRIPLIIHTPGQKPNIINNLTESVDLVPTIIDWLGGEIPIDWNGQSLMPYITNTKKNLKEKKFVVFDWDFRDFTSFVKNKKLSPEECNLSVIRTKKWKYVHFPTLPPLLFNLKDDPQEVKNLANVKKFQNVKNKLLSQLLSHRMLHLERQLSNMKLTKKGPKTMHGPRNRKLKN